jgi:hypothetical protein
MGEMIARVNDVKMRSAELEQAIATGNDAEIDAAIERLADASVPASTRPGIGADIDENTDAEAHAQAEVAIANTLFAWANTFAPEEESVAAPASPVPPARVHRRGRRHLHLGVQRHRV